MREGAHTCGEQRWEHPTGAPLDAFALSAWQQGARMFSAEGRNKAALDVGGPLTATEESVLPERPEGPRQMEKPGGREEVLQVNPIGTAREPREPTKDVVSVEEAKGESTPRVCDEGEDIHEERPAASVGAPRTEKGGHFQSAPCQAGSSGFVKAPRE